MKCCSLYFGMIFAIWQNVYVCMHGCFKYHVMWLPQKFHDIYDVSLKKTFFYTAKYFFIIIKSYIQLSYMHAFIILLCENIL